MISHPYLNLSSLILENTFIVFNKHGILYFSIYSYYGKYLWCEKENGIKESEIKWYPDKIKYPNSPPVCTESGSDIIMACCC